MFKEVSAQTIALNPFDYIGNKWMLITAGNGQSVNTMTASWGGLGIMWNRPVSICYIRPQRYTFEFVEREEFFSLCFFSEEQRNALKVCGTVSGRDRNKIEECGLVTLHDRQAPYFEQAELVFICRKIYADDIKPECFIDKSIADNYAAGDYHRVYYGEVVTALVKE